MNLLFCIVRKKLMNFYTNLIFKLCGISYCVIRYILNIFVIMTLVYVLSSI